MEVQDIITMPDMSGWITDKCAENSSQDSLYFQMNVKVKQKNFT